MWKEQNMKELRTKLETGPVSEMIVVGGMFHWAKLRQWIVTLTFIFCFAVDGVRRVFFTTKEVGVHLSQRMRMTATGVRIRYAKQITVGVSVRVCVFYNDFSVSKKMTAYFSSLCQIEGVKVIKIFTFCALLQKHRRLITDIEIARGVHCIHYRGFVKQKSRDADYK